MKDMTTKNILNLEVDEDISKLTLDVVKTPEFSSEYMRLLNAMEYLEGIKEKVNGKLKELMLEPYNINGQNKVETEKFSVTFIPESYSEIFDTKRFKEENPGLYDLYKKVSYKKSQVRVNKKKGEEIE